MTVYKRGDFFHCDFAVNGKRYRVATKKKSRTQAVAFEARLIAKIVDGAADVREKKSLLLSEAAKMFLEEIDARHEAKNLDGDTKRHYHNGWRMLAETKLAGMRIDAITTGIAASISFPGGAWNARAAQQVLSRILNWCAETGYLRAAPRIKRSKAAGREMRVEPWMEEALLKNMDRDVADVFLIMLDCGMRPEEVMRMRWEHVHWDRRQYFNPYGKTAESRRFVPMADRMIDVLTTRKAAIGGLPEETREKARIWVFPGNTAAGHRSTVAKKYEEARLAAGIDPKLVLYCARHEFGTTYMENGGDLATLKKVMGHTSITTTEKYLHPGIKAAADVINRRNKSGLKIVKSA